jgi:hypothetical protein
MGPEFWNLHALNFILTHSGAVVNGKKGLHAREMRGDSPKICYKLIKLVPRWDAENE